MQLICFVINSLYSCSNGVSSVCIMITEIVGISPELLIDHGDVFGSWK